jgi:hypothetical protein
MIKAIETIYRGHRFRSRLEARWAVFFDTIRLPYTYEAEGYDLDGTWYHPDFWVPAWRSFVEIKPVPPSSGEIEKCRKLATASRNRVLLFVGTPWEGEYKVGLYEPREGEPEWPSLAGC